MGVSALTYGAGERDGDGVDRQGGGRRLPRLDFGGTEGVEGLGAPKNGGNCSGFSWKKRGCETSGKFAGFLWSTLCELEKKSPCLMGQRFLWPFSSSQTASLPEDTEKKCWSNHVPKNPSGP